MFFKTVHLLSAIVALAALAAAAPAPNPQLSCPLHECIPDAPGGSRPGRTVSVYSVLIVPVSPTVAARAESA